jgi:ABC-type transport system involved in cytochrome c biogenesis permease subunit
MVTGTLVSWWLTIHVAFAFVGVAIVYNSIHGACLTRY